MVANDFRHRVEPHARLVIPAAVLGMHSACCIAASTGSKQGERFGRWSNPVSADDFLPEQKRYLEGFAVGLMAGRAGARPAASTAAAVSAPAGPDAAHLAAMARAEGEGGDPARRLWECRGRATTRARRSEGRRAGM